MNTINITNGNCFNDYISRIKPGKFIPFKEAMILGPSAVSLFDKEFVSIRSTFHQTSERDYISHMDSFFNLIKDLNDYDEIVLWFGKDAFCQINLLTIIAYLDFVKYNGSIHSIIIDDTTNRIIRKKQQVIIDDYYKKYISLICCKNIINFIDPYLNIAANDYLFLNDENGFIPMLIKNNSNLSYNKIYELILDNTTNLGLGDYQIDYLINKYKIKK